MVWRHSPPLFVWSLCFVFFFFQAEDGIRDYKVTGVQTCALPIWPVQFSDPDCAFDVRANVAGGGSVTWAGINLCDVKSVTLQRDDNAGAWVDYDQIGRASCRERV